MINLATATRVYFIGIGGIGMSAIARYFKSLGKVVAGYDKTETTLTHALQKEGIDIHFNDALDAIDQHADLVVYTPAIPNTHQGLNWYKRQGTAVLKRSEILEIITEDAFSICIAGTHGKTSTTTLVAHILTHSGYGCNAFLGGIAVNYNTNFWSSSNNVCVIEADEYDRSFLKLKPNIAIITSTDADHLDIYGTHEAVEDAFVQFAERIDSAGLLIRKNDIKRLNQTTLKRQLTYDLLQNTLTPTNDPAENSTQLPEVYATNIKAHYGGYSFDVVMHNRFQTRLQLPMGGLHNVENAVAAYAVAKALTISDDKIAAALIDYRGVKRRFEFVIKQLTPQSNAGPLVFIDDYAHHPTELEALINSAKQMFPTLKCTILFQPHLFSRTRDFAPAFAEALSLADEVWLLPVYAARELPIEGVTSALLANGIEAAKATLLSTGEAVAAARSQECQLFITAGAGDIDKLVPSIAEALLQNHQSKLN
jgi:UDP-N-acetylmuramate--alanine ligase